MERFSTRIFDGDLKCELLETEIGYRIRFPPQVAFKDGGYAFKGSGRVGLEYPMLSYLEHHISQVLPGRLLDAKHLPKPEFRPGVDPHTPAFCEIHRIERT